LVIVLHIDTSTFYLILIPTFYPKKREDFILNSEIRKHIYRIFKKTGFLQVTPSKTLFLDTPPQPDSGESKCGAKQKFHSSMVNPQHQYQKSSGCFIEVDHLVVADK
jgi:hypothetical protein